MIYQDREVRVPVPVRGTLPPELLADCPPDYVIPAEGPLTVGDVLNRLEAVETALMLCRGQLSKLRETHDRQENDR